MRVSVNLPILATSLSVIGGTGNNLRRARATPTLDAMFVVGWLQSSCLCSLASPVSGLQQVRRGHLPRRNNRTNAGLDRHNACWFAE